MASKEENVMDPKTAEEPGGASLSSEAPNTKNHDTDARTTLPLSLSFPDREKLLEERLDRMIFFTDAVVAISLTILVLPLMEDASDGDFETAASWYADNKPKLTAFIVAFFVVWSYWKHHSELFGLIKRSNKLLDFLHLLWLITVTFIPVSISVSFRASEADISVYLSICVVSLVSRFVWMLIAFAVRKHPELWRTDLEQPGLYVTMQLVSTCLDVVFVGIAAGLSVTPVKLFGLLLLLLSDFFTAIIIQRFPRYLHIPKGSGENVSC